MLFVSVVIGQSDDCGFDLKIFFSCFLVFLSSFSISRFCKASLNNSHCISGAHQGERATAINSCNGVFTSKVIFRQAFPAKKIVSDDVRIEQD